MKIEKHDTIYGAIEHAVYALFDAEIPMKDPNETARMFAEKMNEYLNKGYFD